MGCSNAPPFQQIQHPFLSTLFTNTDKIDWGNRGSSRTQPPLFPEEVTEEALAVRLSQAWNPGLGTALCPLLEHPWGREKHRDAGESAGSQEAGSVTSIVKKGGPSPGGLGGTVPHRSRVWAVLGLGVTLGRSICF